MQPDNLITGQIATSNGETVTFENVGAATVYLSGFHDEQGGLDRHHAGAFRVARRGVPRARFLRAVPHRGGRGRDRAGRIHVQRPVPDTVGENRSRAAHPALPLAGAAPGAAAGESAGALRCGRLARPDYAYASSRICRSSGKHDEASNDRGCHVSGRVERHPCRSHAVSGLLERRALPVAHGSHRRLIELTDGRVEALPMPTERHQIILLFLYRLFYAHLQEPPRDGVVVTSGLRMRVREGKFREPDLLLLRDRSDSRRRDRFWLGADLVAEIVSPDDPARDLVVKRADLCGGVGPRVLDRRSQPGDRHRARARRERLRRARRLRSGRHGNLAPARRGRRRRHVAVRRGREPAACAVDEGSS